MFRGTSSPAGIAASLFLVARKHPSALRFSIITTFYFLHPKRIKKVVDMHILSLTVSEPNPQTVKPRAAHGASSAGALWVNNSGLFGPDSDV